MSAVACLRVVLDDNRTDVSVERLGPMMAKSANIFLKVRWTFQGLAKQLSHYSYLLTDPMASELAMVELAQLPGSIGTPVRDGGEEAVKSVLFEGDEAAIADFVNYLRRPEPGAGP